MIIIMPINCFFPWYLKKFYPVTLFFQDIILKDTWICPFVPLIYNCNTNLLFVDWKPRMEIPLDIVAIYVIEFAFYLHSVYACLFMDRWRKDSIVMLFHHFLTMALIGFSYATRSVILCPDFTILSSFLLSLWPTFYREGWGMGVSIFTVHLSNTSMTWGSSKQSQLTLKPEVTKC